MNTSVQLDPETIRRLKDVVRIDRVLRSEALRGCATGVMRSGQRVFVRWARPAASDRFEARQGSPEVEHRVLSAAVTEGVPRAIDLVHVGGWLFSLTSWIDGAAIDVSRRDAIDMLAKQAISILRGLHSRGWIHGDIKPTNLLITRDLGVSIIDWESARASGLPACPGTLGYSAPWTWTEGHIAAPKDDLYSLAVTLWEVWNGRKRYVGTRDKILREQTGHEFNCVEEPPAGVRAIFDYASKSIECNAPDDRAADVHLGLRRSGFIGSLRRHLIKRAVGEIKHRIRSVRNFEVECGVPLSEAADVLIALSCQVRLDLRMNCVTWTELEERARTSSPCQPGNLSRTDYLRDGRFRMVSEAIRIVHELEPIVVLRDLTETAGSSSVWDEFAERLERDGSSKSVFTTTVHIAESHSDAFSSRTDVRELLEIAGGQPSDQDIGEIVEASRQLASPISEFVLSALERRQIRIARHDQVFLSLGEISPIASPVGLRLSHEQLSTDAWLSIGETAAVDGRTLDVARTCIRCHTSSLGPEEWSWADAKRLADLWLECGRPDAAEDVLTRLRGDCSSVEFVVCLGGVRASRGDLRGVADAVMGIECPAEDHPLLWDLMRLRALSWLSGGDTRRAYQELRRILRNRDSCDEKVISWSLVGLGNVLRMMGRPDSARRVLILARSRAEASCSVRASISAAGSLSFTATGERPASYRAREAENLMLRCLRWAMTMDAQGFALMAANWWLIAGDPAGTKRSVEAVIIPTDAYRTAIGGRIDKLISRWLSACDLLGKWSEALRIAPSDEMPESRTYLALLRWEFRIGGEQSGAPCRLSRTLGLAVRVVERNTVRAGTGVRMMRILDKAVECETPEAGHVARYVIAHCRDDAMVQGVLRSAVAASVSTQLFRGLIIAACVQSRVISSEWLAVATEWRDESLRLRPLGVRSWEWSLAMAMAGTITEVAGIEERASIESCLADFESIAVSLEGDIASCYSGRLPAEKIYRLAGISRSQAYAAIPGSAESVIVSLRATLHRAGVRNSGAGVRAYGLERVLQGALQLRGSIDVDSLLTEIASGVRLICRAERAVVIFEGRRGIRAKVATQAGDVDANPQVAEVSETALAQARLDGRARVIDDACDDDCLGERPSVLRFKPRSLIVAPLVANKKSFGFVYVENRAVAKSFSQSDAELIEGYVSQAALALDNAQLVEELRASCRALELARNEAVRAESLRVLGRLASEIAHDFNNLLTAILGETQLMLSDGVGAEWRASLALIERAALDGASAIKRIQDSTRIRTDRGFEPVEVCSIVRDVCDATRVRAMAGDVAVELDALGVEWVHGVAAELREVLTNIITNSMDAMPNGGKLRIIVAAEASIINIVISDTGIGMSEEVASRIFDPFFTTKGERGNGLGLSIAYGIVQRHGGGIRVDSVVGHGTQMRIFLPRMADGAAIASVARDGPAVGSALPGRDLRVLVVDDEGSIARVLGAMLARLGAEPAVVVGGKEGLDAVQDSSRRFDLVISDLHMPGSDGIAIVRASRVRGIACRVVVMTGSLEKSTSSSLETTKDLHGVEILRKPFTIDDVARLLRGLTGAR